MEILGNVSVLNSTSFVTQTQCRACSGTLEICYDFGWHHLSGVFPLVGAEDPPRAPLQLCQCVDCGLLQLSATVTPELMFTDGYGYLSGLNPVMTRHLASIAKRAGYCNGVWLDIGCNDGTLLRNVSAKTRVGFDPVAHKVPGAAILRDFFTPEAYMSLGYGRAQVVSTIAMFYDLSDPVGFARQVKSVLAPDGIWILEVADGELACENWDGICHEHLLYLKRKNLVQILARAGFAVREMMHNVVNGGSIQLWITHGAKRALKGSPVESKEAISEKIENAILQIREAVSNFSLVDVYGASTKGNTLLQACELDHRAIRYAADRNPAKWGRMTPGTKIPIVAEDISRDNPPDAYLVLPWHFKEVILSREAEYLNNGGSMIFPLPKPEIWKGPL